MMTLSLKNGGQPVKAANKTRLPDKKDLFSLGLFLVLAGALLAAVFCFPVSDDESYICAMTQRFLAGDKMFVHEWQITQICTVFLLLPLKLFHLLNGSTEGIILYSRLFFAFCDLGIYLFLCRKIKHLSMSLILSAFLFCSDVFLLSFNYFFGSLFFLCIALFMLAFPKRPLSGRKLLVIGVVFACAVLEEPPFAFAYLIYAFLVLFRRLNFQRKDRASVFFERYSFLFDIRCLKWITIGICVSAVLFLICLNRLTQPDLAVQLLPTLLSSREHAFTLFGNPVNIHKLKDLASSFHPVNLLLLLLIGAAAFFLRKKLREHLPWRIAIFCAALLVFCSCYLHAAVKHEVNPYLNRVPILLFLPTCFSVCRQKDPRMVFLFSASVICSVFVDLLSNTWIFFAGRLAYFPLFAAIGRFLSETSSEINAKPAALSSREKRQKRQRIAQKITVLLVFSVFFFFNIVYLSSASVDLFDSSFGRETFSRGPYRGLKSTKQNVQFYEMFLSDLDDIDRKCTSSFYFAGYFPSAYLYLEKKTVGIHSVYYDDMENTDFPIRYWESFPERRPEFIYIPRFDSEHLSVSSSTGESDENLTFIKSISVCEIEKRTAGYIVRIVKWNDPLRPPDG